MQKDKFSITYFEDILKKNNFKNTPSRMAILQIFSKNDKPISADFIYNKLKNNMNETTVYRTLASFEGVGILKRVDLRKESIFYELNNDHHHHIVCVKCGLIEDFKESKDIEKLLSQIINKSVKFKNVTEHSLELFGFCKVCN